MGEGATTRSAQDSGPSAIVGALPKRCWRRGLPARVSELNGHDSTVRVRVVDNVFVCGDLRVVVQRQAVRSDAPVQHNARSLHDDHAGASHGQFSVVYEVVVRHMTVACRIHAHGRDHDSVFQSHAADHRWLEEFRQSCIVI